MTRKFFCTAAAVLTAAVLAVAAGSAGAQAAGATSAPAAVDDDTQAPPPPREGVAPAEPSLEAPDAPRGRCPHCGAICDGPYGRQRGAEGRPARENRPGRGWAKGPGNRHGGGGIAAERMIRHADDLKLTDEQIETLERLASESKKALVDLHAEIEKEEIEIQDLLRSGSDDIAAVKRHIGAVSKARSAILEERISNFFEARKLLTAEQKKLVKESFPRLGLMMN